jgi:hypothetical protein
MTEIFYILYVRVFTAACGGYSAGIFARETKDATEGVYSFSWDSCGYGFYVFCVGVGFLGLSSFGACFASPDEPRGGGRRI